MKDLACCIRALGGWLQHGQLVGEHVMLRLRTVPGTSELQGVDDVGGLGRLLRHGQVSREHMMLCRQTAPAIQVPGTLTGWRRQAPRLRPSGLARNDFDASWQEPCVGWAQISPTADVLRE